MYTAARPRCAAPPRARCRGPVVQLLVTINNCVVFYYRYYHYYHYYKYYVSEHGVAVRPLLGAGEPSHTNSNTTNNKSHTNHTSKITMCYYY